MTFPSPISTASRSQENICNLFELQVEKSPDAIAIVSENCQLSYQELNQKANQLAHYLRNLGVKPEVFVGLFFDRSPEIVIAIIAVLKAGGAYVPLDPSYPIDRLSFVLEDTRAKLLITHSHLQSQLPPASTDAICLDTCGDAIAQQSSDNPQNWAKPENLAYVMYTSGSTSKPKGVAMPHASILYYVQSLNQILQVQADDIYLHTASFSFSSSVRQLILPLTRGSKLVIASKAQTRDPLSLLRLIQQHQITVFDTVSSVWQYALQQLKRDPAIAWAIAPSSLKKAIFSGGLLTCSLYQQVHQLLGTGVEIFNIYGQTESIGLAAFRIPTKFDRHEGYMPVGYPLAHVQTIILDEELQSVAPGGKGELCVISLGLARQYLNLDELTATRFINYDLLPDRPPVRLYRTGDVARLLSDGTIELVGRTDYQVKIREMRVELEEIEAVLAQHLLVQQAVVTAVDNPNGAKQLIAFVVLKSETQQTELAKILRQFLSKKLPDYMLPTTFLTLDRLPLNPNGKVDRKALPNLDQIQEASAVTYVPPCSSIEHELAEIWQKVLDIPQVGIRDNFFELGGHSLTAIQLLLDIEKLFGVQLSLATLLEAQTVEDLAAIMNAKEPASSSLLVPIRSKGSRKPLFCIHPIGGNTFEYVNLTKYLSADQPIYGVQAQGLDGRQPFLHRVEEMAEHYIQEIRTLQPDGPYLLMGYSFGGLVALEMSRQLHEQGQNIGLLALLDIASPDLNHRRSPLFSFVWGHLNNLHQLGCKKRINYIKEWILWKSSKEGYKGFLLNKVGEDIDPKYFRILDVNQQAHDNYRGQEYLGEAVLFRCQIQPTKYAFYPDLGWSKLIIGRITVHQIPGSHYDVLREPVVQMIAEKLQHYLNEPL